MAPVAPVFAVPWTSSVSLEFAIELGPLRLDTLPIALSRGRGLFRVSISRGLN
jgi:hypothetical protein